jgi:lysophospholipase L1-like esterase
MTTVVLCCMATAHAAQPTVPWKWAASWTTPISSALAKVRSPRATEAAGLKSSAEFATGEFDFALPEGEAVEQSFREIVKPDLWGDRVRVRFSNVFGSHTLVLRAAAIGLQESGGNLLRRTNVQITFGGEVGVSIPAGGQVFSDPVRLAYVTQATRPWLRGRNLAVSFAVEGESGALSDHRGMTVSYMSRPRSGDHTRDDDDTAYPYATKSLFLVSELDVMAEPGTSVVCALGDSITDGGTSINGYDGWSDALARRLHAAYGDRVSVINMGIRGNTVVTQFAGATSEPAVQRLERDVLGISGLTSVVWLEGINDLGRGKSKPGPVIEGYQQVVRRLHAQGILVVGATLTSFVWTGPKLDELPRETAQAIAPFVAPETDFYRRQLNEFIRSAGAFDSVADMARATEDPATGALYKEFQGVDHLHPDRAGHQAMAAAVDLNILAPRARE